eukprot:837816-Prymnesium_polylepis.1
MIRVPLCASRRLGARSSNYQVRDAAAPGPDCPRRTCLQLARTPPDLSRGPARRDRTPDANAASIAPDLLLF